MRIYRFVLALLSVLQFCGCVVKEDKSADMYLARAYRSYEDGRYALARLQIDSIKTLFPKAFDVREEALSLRLKVDWEEQRRNANYIDSMLDVTRKKFYAMASDFYFDKDPALQEYGTYYVHRHRTERNTGRSYLRVQTDERGVMSIVSFYRGRSLDYRMLRFVAEDGAYIEVSLPSQLYVYSDALERIERGDFVLGNKDVVNFISLNDKGALRAVLVGERGEFEVSFDEKDAGAFEKVSELSSLLSTINALEKEQQEVDRHLDFIQRQMKNDSIYSLIE